MSFGCGLDSALGVNWQATRKRNHLNLKEKFTHFCKAKDTVSRTKWQPTDWEKIFSFQPSSLPKDGRKKEKRKGKRNEIPEFNLFCLLPI